MFGGHESKFEEFKSQLENSESIGKSVTKTLRLQKWKPIREEQKQFQACISKDFKKY